MLSAALITRFMVSARGSPGSCRPQMGHLLAPWTLLSGWMLVPGIRFLYNKWLELWLFLYCLSGKYSLFMVFTNLFRTLLSGWMLVPGIRFLYNKWLELRLFLYCLSGKYSLFMVFTYLFSLHFMLFKVCISFFLAVNIHITSWKSCPETSSKRFSEALHQAMADMKKLLGWIEWIIPRRKLICLRKSTRCPFANLK